MAAESEAGDPAILSPEERRQRNHQEMRQAILAVARAVMREQGVAALSLREVARRVRLQAPSLYAYFPSKMALYDALFLEAIRIYSAELDRTGGHRGPFWQRVPAKFEAYLRFAQQHPELYRLAFERPVPGFAPSDATMEESWRLLSGLEDEVIAAIASGEIRPGVPVNEVRDLIIAMLHGLASQHMANQPDLPVGQGRYGSLIPAAVAILYAAWGPEAPTGEEEDRRQTAEDQS